MMKTTREYIERKEQNWHDAIDKLDGNKRKIYDIIWKQTLITANCVCKRLKMSWEDLEEDFEDLKDIGLIMDQHNKENRFNSFSVVKLTTPHYFQGKRNFSLFIYNEKIKEMEDKIQTLKNKIDRIS